MRCFHRLAAIRYVVIGMKHRIVYGEAFSILGIQACVKQGAETSELFGNIWQQFEQNIARIEPLAIGGQYYGINFPTAAEGVSEYLAGMRVADNSPVPDGLIKRTVPAGDYAVLECTVEGIGPAYQHIFGEWLPGAQFAFNPQRPVFEEYPEKGADLPVCIHIPITQAAGKQA